MHFQSLPNETLLQILHSISSVHDVLSLSLTSHRLHDLITRPAQRLPILFSAAEHQLGPLPPAIALCTHNASQPPHLPRPTPPHSLALLRQLFAVGAVANAWADLYPSTHWSGSSDLASAASRRFLTPHERHRLRRACYRIWLYSLAYHNASHSRYMRRQPATVRLRAALLRGWSTAELAEMMDLQGIMRRVLELHVCPSNGTVIRRHKDRFGETGSAPCVSPLVATLSKYQQHSSRLLLSSTPSDHFPSSRQAAGDTWDGWGDDVAHYYVLEDMLKLNPGDIMQLYDFCAGSGKAGGLAGGEMDGWHVGSKKAVVEAHIAQMGEWFVDNGQTLGETVNFVVGERGEDEMEGVGAIVADGMD